jgi:hypothetical protein
MKTICLDFDGVIHQFTTPWSETHIISDPPVPGAFEAIHNYLDCGWKVVVCSARSKDLFARVEMRKWFTKHGATFADHDNFEISEHKPAAILYVDDRGYLFTGQNFPTLDYLENFKPWNKGGANGVWK